MAEQQIPRNRAKRSTANGATNGDGHRDLITPFCLLDCAPPAYSKCISRIVCQQILSGKTSQIGGGADTWYRRSSRNRVSGLGLWVFSVSRLHSYADSIPDGTLTNGAGWGNSGDSRIEGPGQFNFDTTVMKNTRVGGIHESALLQFRAEFFNLFNHPQFGNQGGVNPVPFFNNVANGNFGQIGATSLNPRLIQLALKYIF
jgi:hypothetical protein